MTTRNAVLDNRNERTLLMIFAKNPVLGKVKTRLARSIGNRNALRVYRELLSHTHHITKDLNVDKAIYYSDEVDKEDLFENGGYQKFIQKGEDLGEKMGNAFKSAFFAGYERVVIIGADCYEITQAHLDEAMRALEHEKDIVLGPAKDGGYYLLGMKDFHPELFRNKEWSTSNVFLDTLLDVQNKDLDHHLLPTLNDVDTEKDLGELRKLLSTEARDE